jgi:polar amino acid transport system substrate-binding protein
LKKEKVMKKRFAAVAIAAFFAVVASYGARADDVITKIQKSGVLRVGVAPSPPDQSPNPDTGNYEGYNIDIGNQIAKILNVKLEVVPATWATLVSGLGANQYDMILSNLYATPERALVVTFTQPYAYNGLEVMVRKDSPIKTLDDLNSTDVTFSAMSGSVDAMYPAQLYPKSKTNALVSENVAAPVQEVVAGRASAYMIDTTTYPILSAQNPQIASQTRVLNDADHLIKPVGLAYAVRPEDAHLLNFLNVFIQDRINNGDFKALRQKWFDEYAKKK